jgi:hypothetical protein
MMFVTKELVLLEKPNLATTKTGVPTITAILRPDLARIPTTLLLAVMVMLALTTCAREEFVCLVLVRTVTMVMFVPTIRAIPILAPAFIITILLLATTVTLVLRMTFALMVVVFPARQKTVMTIMSVPPTPVRQAPEAAYTRIIIFPAPIVTPARVPTSATTDNVSPANLKNAMTITCVPMIPVIVPQVLVYLPITKLPALMVMNVH